MERKTYPVLILLAAAILVAGAFLLPRGTQPVQAEGPVGNRLTVSGDAEIALTPDLARLVLGVETQAATAAQAQQKNAEAMNAVAKALRKAGVAEKDMQTANYNLNPVYDNRLIISGRPKVTGYTASNQLRITVRDLAKVGNLIDAAVQAGATNVNGLTFTVADQSAWEKQALEQAIANAGDKAETMAKAAGVTMGRPVQISASVTPASSEPQGPVFYAKSMEMDRVPIAAGQVLLRAHVEMAWEI